MTMPLLPVRNATTLSLVVLCLATSSVSLATPAQPSATTSYPIDTVAPARPTGARVLQVGVALGVTQLFGDLSSPTLKPAFGLTLTYPIRRAFSLQLLGDLGALGAQQQAFYNTQAKASFTQASVGTSVSLSELINGKNRQQQPEQARSNLSVYLTYGMIFFKATAYSLSDGSVQRLTNGPGSHRTASDNYTARGIAGVTQTHEVVVPLGLRYSSPLSRSLSLTVDLRYNVVHTDKLDATFDSDNSTIKSPTGGDIFGPIPSGHSLDSWGALSVGLAYRPRK